MRVLHIAQIEVTPNTGMGRVAFHWQSAFVRRGHDFIHLGSAEVGPQRHPALFPLAAFRRARALRPRPDVVLVHEPASAPFALTDPARTAVFSHGIERRAWELETVGGSERLRTQLLFPLWRLLPSDIGLSKAQIALVLNSQDHAFACSLHGRSPINTFRISNGVTDGLAARRPLGDDDDHALEILFVGTWLQRKGISSLVEAAILLDQWGVPAHWTLAGTGALAADVLRSWPSNLRGAIKVVPSFSPTDEASIFAPADVFVLPSFFEGQPLSLLQAMRGGLCCVVSRIGPHEDLITNEIDGLLHAAGDAHAFAHALARCARDPELRRACGVAAQNRVRYRTWELCSDEVVRIVENNF